MYFEKTHILGLDYVLPESALSSIEIEERLIGLYQKFNLSQGRLELMTGIRSRSYWPRDTLPSDLATQAAEKLLQRTRFNREKIGLLIHASVCRDCLEPSTASTIHANLKLRSKSMVFDLSNACLGALNGMVIAANMIERRQIEAALVVTGENGGPLLFDTINSLQTNPPSKRSDLKKDLASLTIGSCATAVLMVHQNDAYGAPRLLGGAYGTHSKANHLCRGDKTDQWTMKTDSEALLKEGIYLARQNWDQCKESLEWTNSSVDWVLAHQVGHTHESQMNNALDLDGKKTFRTYPDFGNTGSSALPFTLAKSMERSNGPQRGERIALLGIGSGLAGLMLGVQV